MKVQRIFILTLLLLSFTLQAWAQVQNTQNFDERLLQIEIKLDQLADSLLPGLRETANFSVVNASVQDLLRGLAETHRLNISVDPTINARITNNFSGVQVKNLILFLCREYRLDVRFLNTIITFYPYQQTVVKPVYKPQLPNLQYDPRRDYLSVDLKRDSLSVFVRYLTQESGKNVIVSPNVNDRQMTGYLSNVPFDQGLEKIAFVNGLELNLTDDGFYVLGNPENTSSQDQNTARGGRNARNNSRSGNNRAVDATEGLFIEPINYNGDTLYRIEANNVPVKDVIREAAQAFNKDYILYSEPNGSAFTNTTFYSFEDLLSYLLMGSAHGYQKQQDIYLIGERAQEGFRSSRLFRFQYRTLTNTEKLIPAELAKGIQITPFPDLNALVLSGPESRLTELEVFLKQIDQPVANIIIEVVVIDVRQGYEIQTGLTAGLSGDSTVTTQGTVTPGLDLTLSGQSVNNALGKLEDAGIVNLGRVKPNFYVQLKAMEDNDNIKIRSTPRLSTLNGHEATLSIGQSRYYVEQTSNVTGGVQPIVTQSQRFNKVEANLSIKLNPIVSGDEHVTLQIEAEFSDFVEPTIEGAPPGNATRKFLSNIRVKNEEMIVLGGLEEARKSSGSSGMPVLSRIPILKWIFSSRKKSKRDDKLVIFIKPTVVY